MSRLATNTVGRYLGFRRGRRLWRRSLDGGRRRLLGLGRRLVSLCLANAEPGAGHYDDGDARRHEVAGAEQIRAEVVR